MLINSDGAFDRAAIMRDAHREYRQMRSFGWSWSRCLSFSWARARAMQEAAMRLPHIPTVAKAARALGR